MSCPIRLEVTGTSAMVSSLSPLWILEGKARYADDHPEQDIYIVHVLNPPHRRPVVRVIPARGLRERYPVEIKHPYGAPERYLVLPPSAPEIMREEIFFDWLGRRYGLKPSLCQSSAPNEDVMSTRMESSPFSDAIASGISHVGDTIGNRQLVLWS